MEIITFNDCRKCGSKPRVRAFGSLHLVTCPECLEETLSDPDLAVLAKRWNELNPARPVGINLSKAFSPIKEIRLTARIDDLDLETEPEDEPEDETDMAPESEPVIPSGWSHATAFSENPKIYVWNHGGDQDQESETETEPEPDLTQESDPVFPVEFMKLNRCLCGSDALNITTSEGEAALVCRDCGKLITAQTIASLIVKWNEQNPIQELKDSFAKRAGKAFREFMQQVHLYRQNPDLPRPKNCLCGGEPELFDLGEGIIQFVCQKCGKSVCSELPISSLIEKWNRLNTLDSTLDQSVEPERPNLDPGRGPCTCPGFDSPLQYQVGGDHYRRFSYQPVMFFRETNLDFDRANAIKYLARVGHKGDPVEDLEKAAQYLQFYEVRRMYENSLCEQFVDQIDEVPIRHAIRYLFSGEVTLAKMALDRVMETFKKPEEEKK